MATLLLTSVGTLFGGPLGGALGAFAGQQIDTAIFGGGQRRHGPRLKELAVSTSSYGHAIARHFGQVRTPGTIIWATDLKETKESGGGGKGKPRTTTYSYSISLAVAVSSQPIRAIGRIWADGNLLRGTTGDLKTAGALRVYLGDADQGPDPLIAGTLGSACPAFRDCAYVVMEDLALGDFGNRIPSLTFEVFGREEAPVRLSHLVPGASTLPSTDRLEHLLGFSDEGGDIAAILSTIGEVYPLSCTSGAQGLSLARVVPHTSPLPMLPSELVGTDGDRDDLSGGSERSRAAWHAPEPNALRYYDRDRDYQAGVQLAPGRHMSGATKVVELPATLSADDARTLCLANAVAHKWRREQVTWRIAELDPEIQPGSMVTLPGRSGRWIVSSWEWLDRGIELVLERLPAQVSVQLTGDAGDPALPPDLAAASTRLLTFELPASGTGSPNTGSYFAAIAAGIGNWTGASLYLAQDTALIPIGVSTRETSTLGHLVTPLGSSHAMVLERNSALEVDLTSPDQGFTTSTPAAIAGGANRLYVGGEIIQFAGAEQTGELRWRLTGLLRGRGGTEHLAAAGHPAGQMLVSLDEGLVAIDPALAFTGNVTRFAAIGLGDAEPVYSDLAASGISLNPLAPVHARVAISPDGDWTMRWTRRARGQWRWLDLVDAPLIEEGETYEVGAGSLQAPVAVWRTSSPGLSLTRATIEDLRTNHGALPVWVRQIGTFGISPATLLKHIS